MKEPEIIYQQRYETFRYLDRLLWQVMQIGIASGSVILAIRNGAGSESGLLSFGAAGLVLFFSALAMCSIRRGIRANSIVLSEAGELIGDTRIPPQRSDWKSVSAWISVTMGFIGIILMIVTVCAYFEDQL